MATRTFVDSGVLIAAARGNNELVEAAMKVLDDPEREFVSSDFVKLEVLPKATYHKNTDEALFYREFLSSTVYTVHASKELVAAAHSIAEKHGLAAMDALHVAAAREVNAAEIVTSEKSGKPMFRVHSPVIRTIRPS